MIQKLFIVLIFSLLPIQSMAQNGGFAGAGLSLGFGPRGMALSNAMAASTSEGVYPYYNPALAAYESQENQVDFSVAALAFDRIYQTASATFQLPPNAGIAIGIIRSGVKDFDERTLSGYPVGIFDISEYQLNTSFGLRFSQRFYGGVGFKLNYANYHEDLSPSTAVGVDIGILIRITEQINFAMAVQDMFANYTWNSGDLYGQSQSRNVVNNFPTRLKWALAYQVAEFSFNTEYELQTYVSEVSETEIFISQDGSPIPITGLNTINTNSGILKFAGVWNAHERITLRSGYRISDTKVLGSGSFSTGFSVHLPFDTFAPSIDYAFVQEPHGVANIHVFAVRLHL